MIKLSLVIILTLFSFSPDLLASPASQLDTIFKNNKAVKQMVEERHQEAFNILSQALVDAPGEAALSYNLGLTFESNEEKEKALKAYAIAAKQSGDPELKFSALFNAARMAGDLKQLDLAVSLYQQALDIKPDSVETKNNIELLFQASSGGGGGESDKKEKEKNEKGDNKKEQEPNQNQDRKNEPDKKPTPKPFQSKELSQQDVNKILDELRRQEENIRAKFNEKNRKESPVEKDW